MGHSPTFGERGQVRKVYMGHSPTLADSGSVGFGSTALGTTLLPPTCFPANQAIAGFAHATRVELLRNWPRSAVRS
jgi:hypothetical protein